MIVILNAGVAVLAFIKDLLTATYLGTSMQADAFTLAYFIPDTFGSNLLAGSIGISCVPIFSKLLATGQHARLWRTIRGLLIYALILASVNALLLFLGAPHIISWFSSNQELVTKIIPLYRIMLPIVVMAPLLCIGFSYLQSRHLFALPAGAWMAVHLLVIMVIFASQWLRGTEDQLAIGLSVAVSLGFAVMLLLTWRRIYAVDRPARGTGISGWKEAEYRQIRSSFYIYLVFLLSNQAVYILERMLAIQSDVGTVTGLNYAFRLSQLPIAVFVLAISSVVLPSMSRDIAMDDKHALQSTVVRAILQIGMISIPTTILLFVLRVPIVSVLFQRGAFTADSVRTTADMVSGYSLTICGLSVTAICVRYLLAAHKISLLLRVSMIACAANVIADLWLNAKIGAVGLAYGAFLGSAVSGILFIGIVWRDLRLSAGHIARPILNIASANIPIGVIAWIGSLWWLRESANASFLQKMLYLLIVLGAAAIVYWLCIRKLQRIISI